MISSGQLFWHLFAYLVGGIPTGYLVARLRGVSDLRKYGSGTIGATNAARILGPTWFFVVLAIDAGKAYAALWLTYSFSGLTVFQLRWLPIMLVMGNTHSPFLGFTGGKGVATSLGIVAFLVPQIAAIAVAIWLLVFTIVRNVAVASVCSLGAVPVSAYLMAIDADLAVVLGVISGWCAHLHVDRLKSWWQREVRA